MEYSQIVVNKGYDGLNPVILGTESCKKGHAYGPAIRSYYLIHYVISGRGIFVSKGETHKVSAGEMFVITPGEETFYKADDTAPWEYIWIGFTSDSPLPMELAPKIICPEAQTIFKDMLSCGKMEKGRSAYLSARLWDLFSVLLEKSTQTDDYIDKALSCLNAEYMMGITISELARRMNLERTYFYRLFKNRVGISPSQYLFELRMKKASELLLKKNQSPKSTAVSVGYSDIYLFSKMFKKKFGLSPREYKKQNSK